MDESARIGYLSALTEALKADPRGTRTTITKSIKSGVMLQKRKAASQVNILFHLVKLRAFPILIFLQIIWATYFLANYLCHLFDFLREDNRFVIRYN